MSHEKLALELADFWFPAIADQPWEERLRILDEVHGQLYQDLETVGEYEQVSASFVAALIDRLGSPPITHPAQAQIYASSSEERHWGAAMAWQFGEGQDAGATTPMPEERRRWPREIVNRLTEMWVQGRPARCRLVDISRYGARVMPLRYQPRLPPGTPIRVMVAEGSVRDGVVVFSSPRGVGLQFANAAH
ncbi:MULTISPECIES: PilZ domain-containing protein [unclassified Thioalkalivibrio]|uniref:PilZ domain-containing protein n=1 Tax=unclassified Thioalkalivibrio TaxID=2621013 RepID=UPI00036E3ECD|nr:MULTISPECIES: PilZ domain-containing protein [unclassified Thioalkalivibrio]